MLNANAIIPNTSNSFDAMLEAFFCVQPNEHVKAWSWHQFTKNSDMDAIDRNLAQAAKELRDAR